MYAVIRNNAAGSLQIVAYHPGTPLPFGWQVVFVGNFAPASKSPESDQTAAVDSRRRPI